MFFRLSDPRRRHQVANPFDFVVLIFIYRVLKSTILFFCFRMRTYFFNGFYLFLNSFLTPFFINNWTFHTLSTKRPDMRFDCAMASGLRFGPLEIYPKMLKNRLQKCPRNEALKKKWKKLCFGAILVSQNTRFLEILAIKMKMVFWPKKQETTLGKTTAR